jgi:Rrf2 family protein
MVRESETLYSAKFLDEALNIPDKYLCKLMTILFKVQYIKSTQGKVGGYSFNKIIKNIYLSDIINTVEGMSKYKNCVLGFDNCFDDNPLCYV